MGGEAGQGQLRIVGGRLEASAVALEPQHAIGEDQGGGELFAQAIRNGAEVFADDHAAMAMAFDGGDGEQRIDGEIHIGAKPAFGAARYPELAGKAQDVIDAECRRMAHVGRQDRPHRPIGQVIEDQRRQRWQVPHLATA